MITKITKRGLKHALQWMVHQWTFWALSVCITMMDVLAAIYPTPYNVCISVAWTAVYSYIVIDTFCTLGRY